MLIVFLVDPQRELVGVRYGFITSYVHLLWEIGNRRNVLLTSTDRCSNSPTVSGKMIQKHPVCFHGSDVSHASIAAPVSPLYPPMLRSYARNRGRESLPRRRGQDEHSGRSRTCSFLLLHRLLTEPLGQLLRVIDALAIQPNGRRVCDVRDLGLAPRSTRFGVDKVCVRPDIRIEKYLVAANVRGLCALRKRMWLARHALPHQETCRSEQR